ncbi:hypothetical protein HanRHA438_Chr16g0752431 [Helianthus annuus]|uniref:Uncharacterized protein n=1 Tax=Helianthus annuus TaxID=4232 RepID=A0A251ULI2_HELAN|nr:hypothetical protein HanXRQr2_Chr16g0740171 [Helianthus annuus]KAJ0437569.1 hypothetical protein HanHA300_Chr16g0603621 [Helianthus annuus]KAJ0442059.1 hypothetical protein HanIR_Chr16g0804831 [Helianthus annuus]KAJ0459896.1 hypothetical protein HanHA89_Chr16g0654261 [Helianthus annuus]KAJ0644307.1 hypothetical protein HanOQP8_Chr16g0610521 [Helianthus annuus]
MRLQIDFPVQVLLLEKMFFPVLLSLIVFCGSTKFLRPSLFLCFAPRPQARPVRLECA